MPRLEDLLAHTLVHTASRDGKIATRIVDIFDVPRPHPDPIPEDASATDAEAMIRHNAIWQWQHGPTPGVFHHLTARVRGMGMNYHHPMPVADAVVFDHVRIQRSGGTWIDLPIAEAFVLRKEFLRRGNVHGGTSSWWPCQLPIDASGIVVLGYEASPVGVVPIADRGVLETEFLMPGPKAPAFFSMVAGERSDALIIVDRHRYIVVLELATGREDNTFVTGLPTGFARLHPLVWVTSSEDLARVEVQTTVQRPSKTVDHGDEAMMPQIHALASTDTNQEVTSWAYVPGEKRALTWWDLFFTGMETNAFERFSARELEDYDHPDQLRGEVTMSDPRFVGIRTIDRAITRLCGRKIDSVTKMPRQGQFDNIHLAPRMQITFDEHEWKLGIAVPTGRQVTLDQIAMAPFCIHDCLHMHLRWGVAHDEKTFCGFSGSTPHMLPGGTTVPNNQVVFASLPNRHTVRLRCIADAVKAGEPQVFNHHGFGYVSDVWPGGDLLIEPIKQIVEYMAAEKREPYPLIPATGGGWSRLYWRLRYGVDESGKIAERLWTNWAKVMAPE